MFDASYPPPFRGGKERQAHLLGCALRDLGVSVRVLTLKYGADQPDNFEGIAVTRCSANASRFAVIPRHLNRWRADCNICHVHTPSRIGIYVGLAARLLGYRVIFKIPDEHETMRHGRRRRLWCASLRAFHRILVLDERTRREYETARVPPERIVLASNGVAGRARRRPNPENGRPVQLLFLGRFVNQKGCSDLLAVAQLLKAGETGWHLTMMGSGPLEAELRATIATSGLSDRVTLKPWRDDVDAVLREADVLVAPSRHEGMPNVVLEAMSVGLPVVATDVGAVARVLGQEGASFVVVPNDVERFRDAVLSLTQDPVKREAYGAALHARARSAFDMPVIARQYRQLYKQVLSE